MASLIETNPYLRDSEQRRRLLEENAHASSVFEGACSLPPVTQTPSRKRRSSVSRKKAVKSS